MAPSSPGQLGRARKRRVIQRFAGARWLPEALDSLGGIHGVQGLVLVPATMENRYGIHIRSTTWTVIYRIANGKLAEHWINSDDVGLLRQLGAIS